MNFSITAIFYGLVGAGVAVALFVSDSTGSRHERWFRVLTAFLFWPLYLPLLLRPTSPSVPTTQPSAAPSDELAAQITQVETEFDVALKSLSVGADTALLLESDRVGELPAAWRSQAERIRELDRLLAQPAFIEAIPAGSETERAAQSEQSRQQNLARLRAIRQQMHQNLLGTLSGVRELVTRIHLAKYTGSPTASELIAQFTAANARLSELSDLPTK
ncbi:MAG: hypothetical protein IAG10_01900 [Planctomycetaceae bacterium]|nr:hypothetical protein [Planctomycetaceae bacterium]